MLREVPIPVSDVTCRWARCVANILVRCLRKDPSQRYQKIAEVRSSLKRLKADYYGNIVDGSFFTPYWERVMVRVFLGVLLAAAGAAGVAVWRNRPGTERDNTAQLTQ